MLYILRMCNPFKVINTIVISYAVYVIYIIITFYFGYKIFSY